MKTGNLIFIYGGKSQMILENKQYSILSATKERIKNERHYLNGRLLVVKNNSSEELIRAYYNELDFGKYNYKKDNLEFIKKLIDENHGYPNYELEFTSDYSKIVKKQLVTLRMF